MKMKTVIGEVFNPYQEKFQLVVGYEFDDCPGYYQFFAIGCLDHFRATPQPHIDDISVISMRVYRAIREMTE